ncbi:MAG: aldehyde dehydrogenase family protein, partial [Bythopirellula sp.]
EPFEAGGRLRVPVFPTTSLFDRLLFGPIRAHVRAPADSSSDALFGDGLQRIAGRANDQPEVTLVLGAGNVSSIPITDTLTKIMQDNQAVLLKMNPVNEYVGPIFERAFAPLIDADLLRIVYGGADVGANLISDSDIDRVHITGSDRTHDAIVWGSTPQEQADRKAADTPLLQKPITSELGNVSPWIVVPGRYSERQLRFQAEHLVASVTTNASFVCIATKMLITCESWPQREQFVNLVDEILAKTPRRFAYYPGAADRFARFAGCAADDPEHLPWTLRRDVAPEVEPQLFEEESFACVFGETALAASSPTEFLNLAVDFANEQMWGTLSAALSVPREFQKQCANDLDRAIDRLRYGIVGINLWPGVAFALMSTPWGAFPGASLQDIQSGRGNVHNTYLLEQTEKTVISSPLTFLPKPMWFSTHRRPESLARSLLRLYLRPSLGRILPVLSHALRG